MMEYKGYTARLEIDDAANTIFGRVLGLRDVVTFQGASVEEARQAFHESVDDYVEMCRERGVSPEKPYSGKFLLRISPELHRSLSSLAEAEGKSLNGLIESLLESSTAARRLVPHGAGRAS